jgi:hypothetical protein
MKCTSTADLNQDVEHDSMLVHRSPQPMLPARDADGNFVEVPYVDGPRLAR